MKRAGELRRVAEPVSARLEMTAVSDSRAARRRVRRCCSNRPDRLQNSGPDQPVRDARPGRAGHGRRPTVGELRDIGELLANLKEPEPPKGLRDAGRLLQMAKALWDMQPATSRSAPCREVVLEGDDIDLGRLPVQTCWPEDAGPLITWGLVITRGPQGVPGAAARARTSASTASR